MYKYKLGDVLLILGALSWLLAVLYTVTKPDDKSIESSWQHIDTYQVGDDHYPHEFKVYRSNDGKKIIFLEVER